MTREKITKLVKQIERRTNKKYTIISAFLSTHISSILEIHGQQKFFIICEKDYDDIFSVLDNLEVDINTSIINIKNTNRIPKHIFPIAISNNDKKRFMVMTRFIKKNFLKYHNGKYIYHYWKGLLIDDNFDIIRTKIKIEV